MSAAQTIPMFAPDGSLGDIPIEQANAARAAGAKPAVNILDPQGNHGYVPADRVQDAVQAGGKVLPFEQQETAKPGVWDTVLSDLKGMFTNIPTVTSPYPGADLERKQQVAQQSEAEDQSRQAAGYGPLYRAAAPIAEAAGTNVAGMEQAAKEGNPSAVIGHAAAGAGVAAAPLVAEGAVRGAKAATGAVENIGHPTGSVRAALPEETAGLPDNAVRGAEKIFQASAPTGTNTRFRANVLAAAGDLAEVGRDVDTRLQQAKGGIIQPDMRARVTVDAINQHLADMYNSERAPQIANHANAPVDLPPSENTAAGLTQMTRSGEAGVAKLAAKARAGSLTLAEADELARGVNAELRKYEAMTPEAQAAARVNTKSLSGLKALDRELSESIDDQLRIDGQPGIREYERRYAALSSLRDQIRVRMNTAELQHPGPIKAAARAARNVVSGMSGNIAGASQAAVSDVRMGRALQQGLRQLADSGIKANRALPRTPAPLELTPPPGRVPPATQQDLNFNGADQEPGPKTPERRGGGDKGGPRATVLSDAEREQIRAKLRDVEGGGHSNPLVGNPFDRHPSLGETIKSPQAEAALKGALDALSGR